MTDKLKILIVDDEDSLRLSLASILELEGYEVQTAEDGFKAIELAKKEEFNILFSDIRMPGITGNETFKEIKKIKPDIIGVMMTAYALNDLIIDALNSGAFACLSKPFEIEAVLSTIKDITSRPFAVVIDKEANVDQKFLNSLKNCGLNIASSEMDLSKVAFMFKHKPDILIIAVHSEEEENKTLDILNKLKDKFGKIPKTVIIEKNPNSSFVDKAEKLGTVNFFESPINVKRIFTILGTIKRKQNIALVNMDTEDFESLNKALAEEGFHLLSYTDCNKLYEELNNSFFDIALINAKVDTNIAEFHDKLQKEMPNIGAIYLLNDDKNLEAVKQKGCFYLTKPFEIENVISLINKILGK
ncbi:MAG: response regulator [Elusimicrobia bacterium]|nr:response regulator [Elusimicrobiota bacterium]